MNDDRQRLPDGTIVNEDGSVIPPMDPDLVARLEAATDEPNGLVLTSGWASILVALVALAIIAVDSRGFRDVPTVASVAVILGALLVRRFVRNIADPSRMTRRGAMLGMLLVLAGIALVGLGD